MFSFSMSDVVWGLFLLGVSSIVGLVVSRTREGRDSYRWSLWVGSVCLVIPFIANLAIRLVLLFQGVDLDTLDRDRVGILIYLFSSFLQAGIMFLWIGVIGSLASREEKKVSSSEAAKPEG